MKTTKKLFILVIILIPSLLNAQWNIQTIDNSGDVGQYNDIAYDSQGNPHIVYYNQSEFSVMYAYWNTNGWTIEKLDNSYSYTYGPIYSSIAIDTFDQVHICYNKYTHNLAWDYLIYTKIQSDGNRQNETILTSGGGRNKYQSISLCLEYVKVTGNIIPHICYKFCDFIYEPDIIDFYYCTYNYITSTWEFDLIDGGTNVGDWNDMAIDANGNLYVSYYDATDKDLKFAYYDGTSWSTQIIDGLYSDVGQMTSIALDQNGVPHITYYDETNGNLKHATVTITE